ncbi:hypothetical protein Wcon_00922 [Wolbachia endosymbiont of Cylisticus convexus]|uniref:portal protein n=1 Tax=Wolbachia endosymbiont of Cylisticus convexus TaxID=118728 RepID=UPI000DF6B50D|nr:hypothetical protein [Wolbachia endosymbiont of Cylisticus convexus]RDD34959.1 hypothetical protein Wcon_00922 [Wolbachia endosymbiont of Cylisticus convexus]
MGTRLEYLTRLRNSWFDYWSGNIEQARRQHKFVVMGEQYTENEKRELLSIGAEPIVFNVTFAMAEKILNTVRGKKYDLELKVNGESPDPQVMQFMHGSITDLIFSQDHYVEYSKALKEAIIGGYSALYIGFGYNNEDIEDDELTFKIRAINGTESFFFDPHSNEPHKGDGRYCGITHRLYKTSLEKMGYAQIERLEFKDKDTVPYIEVTDLYLKKNDGITFYRFTNEEILESKELYGHRHLPLVFHGGCSHYIDNREVTRPLGVMCHYAQKTYNHCIAMMNYGAKYFQNRFLMPQASVASSKTLRFADPREMLLEYATVDGIQPIVIPPTGSDPNLAVLMQQALSLLSQIWSDTTNIVKDSKYSSAAALRDKLRENEGSVTSYYFAHQITLNQVGNVLLSLLPYKLAQDDETLSSLINFSRSTNVKIKISESLEKQREKDNELMLNVMQYLGPANQQISVELLGEMLLNQDTVSSKILRDKVLSIGQQQQEQQMQQAQQPSEQEIKLLEIQSKERIAELKAEVDLLAEKLAVMREEMRNAHEEKMLREKSGA